MRTARREQYDWNKHSHSARRCPFAARNARISLHGRRYRTCSVLLRMEKPVLPPRPAIRRTTPVPGESLSMMALSDEEAEFFATQPSPEPSADDTWTDAPKIDSADQTWIETPLPRALRDPDDDLEDVEWSGDVAVPPSEHRKIHRAGPFRIAAAAIFAELVAVALLSTTRRSTVPTVHAAEPVMAYRRAPMPAILAQAEPTQEIELLPTPAALVPAKLVKADAKLDAKPTAKAKALTKPTAKPAVRKPSKVKSSF